MEILLRWHLIVKSCPALPVFYIGILHKTLTWQRSQEVLSGFQAAMLSWSWALWGFFYQPDLDHSTGCWIILQLFSLKAAEVTPMAQAMKRYCGDGSGLCWLLSITDMGLGTLSWAVSKCVGGITAVCLSLCCGFHLPLYPCEADLMKGLGQSPCPAVNHLLSASPRPSPTPARQN